MVFFQVYVSVTHKCVMKEWQWHLNSSLMTRPRITLTNHGSFWTAVLMIRSHVVSVYITRIVSCIVSLPFQTLNGRLVCVAFTKHHPTGFGDYLAARLASNLKRKVQATPQVEILNFGASTYS